MKRNAGWWTSKACLEHFHTPQAAAGAALAACCPPVNARKPASIPVKPAGGCC